MLDRGDIELLVRDFKDRHLKSPEAESSLRALVALAYVVKGACLRPRTSRRLQSALYRQAGWLAVVSGRPLGSCELIPCLLTPFPGGLSVHLEGCTLQRAIPPKHWKPSSGRMN